MFNRCSVCTQNVGFFKLKDTVCCVCRDRIGQQKGRISQIFGFSPFWGFVFVAGLIVHSVLLAVRPPGVQIILSIGLMALALLSLVFSLIIRFLLLRRKLHTALAIALSFPFAGAFLSVVGMVNSSPVSITTIGFIFFPYYILCLPNAWVQSEA